MNEIKIFENSQFGNLRTVSIDGEPWFVGKDVATILGYSNSRKALADHVDQEDKGVTKCDTLGGTQEISVINESGLYSLILSSKLPAARQFKRWITSDVLPQIRQTGAYLSPNLAQQVLSDPATLSLLLSQLAQERSARLQAESDSDAVRKELAKTQARLDHLAPGPFFLFPGDPALQSVCSVSDLAREISRHSSYPMSRNMLYKALRFRGYIRPDSPLPSSLGLESGYLLILSRKSGSHHSFSTAVTLAGQLYFTAIFT